MRWIRHFFYCCANILRVWCSSSSRTQCALSRKRFHCTGSVGEAPLTTAFLLFATLHGFVFGARLPKKFTKLVHPLVTCTSITWLSAKLLGLVNGCSFATMLGKYRTGTSNWACACACTSLFFLHRARAGDGLALWRHC